MRLRFVGGVTSQVRFNDNVACLTCGQFGAYEFDGGHRCADCYASRGACCAEAAHEPHWECPRVDPGEEPADG